MKLSIVFLAFLFLFVLLCGVDAKQYKSGGGSSHKKGSIFRTSKPKPQESKSSTSIDKTSSADFLKSESSKHLSDAAPKPTARSKPLHSTTRPSSQLKNTTGIVHESHQKSDVNNDQSSNPYSQQPAHNPYFPKDQPHSHIPPPPNGIPLPTSRTSHSSYPPPPPPHTNPSYYPHAPYQPAYSAPPPSAPFVPGHTIIVLPESGNTHSSGSGLGNSISNGIAAGATKAIVDHAISSIFRPSAKHVHTYPNPPAPGTSTTVNINIYYEQPGLGNNTGNNNAPVTKQPASVNGPVQGQPGKVQAQPGSVPSQPGLVNGPVEGQSGTSQGLPGVQANPGTDSKGNPSLATNGATVQTPTNQPETPAPNNKIPDEDLMKFTEELFEKQDKNLNQYVELNLQKRISTDNAEQGKPVLDEAPEPLFNLKPELDSIPTVSALRALYDNYERDGTKNEVMTPERRQEESTFLEEVVKTPVMSRALEWLVQNKYVEPDEYEKKDVLRRMWFTTFGNTSSGFERIFLSEKFGDSGIVGMQNWLYFANLEAQKNVNYLGYAELTSLSGKGSLLKLNYQTEGFTIQNATIFVGTTPELELALYTVCFYARPMGWCPISIGGAKFFILTSSFRWNDKDLIDLGFPAV